VAGRQPFAFSSQWQVSCNQVTSGGHSLFGFRSDPEAKYFHGQAASEAAVMAATDWNAAA
jgi:hypothetical protein